MQAVWNNTVVAESADTVVVDGNHYFPESALRKEFFLPSVTTSVCSWKGIAGYYSLRVNGQENRDAAWFYAEPKPAAAEIRGRVAFWRGVQVKP